MPELPEVEAARQAIEEHCLGRKIVKSIVADDRKVIDGVSYSDFEAAITGKTIVAAHRKGKNMWLQLDSPPFPSFQFGMAGAVYIKGVAVTKYKRSAVKDSEEWPSKYSMLFIQLDDGLEFSFTDKRRFAKVRLLDNPVSAPPISELGPDALLEPMTVDAFCNSLSKKRIGIKALLLDQSFISGIGNWMADEVLYQARIHPQQSALSMTKENCSTLLKCINEVIKNAVEVGADNNQFPSNWIFHSREKKPGKAFIDGKKIEFITAGGRTTAFVPELQKLTGNQAVKESGKSSKNKEQRRKSNARESKPGRSKKISNKKSSPSIEGSDDDDDDDESLKKTSGGVEDLENDEDSIDADAKSSKNSRGAKNPPTRSKPDRNNKNGRDSGRKQTSEKKTLTKRKHKDSDDELHDSIESGDENYVANTTMKGVSSSKKMAGSSQNRKQQTKKSK